MSAPLQATDMQVAATSLTATTTLDSEPAEGALVLRIPAAALPAETTVLVGMVGATHLAFAAPPPSGRTALAGFLIQARVNGTPVAGGFGAPVSIDFTVPASSVPPGTGAFIVTLASWNGTVWVTADASVTRKADTSLHIQAEATHFTLFAVLQHPVDVSGTFASTPIVSAEGYALAVLQGGTIDQLESAACLSGARGVWAQDATGAYQLLVVDGPLFLREIFRSRFPSGFSGPISVTLDHDGRYAPTTLDVIELNTSWNGVFHSGTWLAAPAGVLMLWLAGRNGAR